MHIGQLEVFGDSQPIIQQINGQYEVRNAKLVPLYQRTKNLVVQFLQIKVNHMSRSENDKADASVLDRFDETEGKNVVSIFEVEEEAD